MRVRINLDTMSSIQKFVNICSSEKGKIYLTDGNEFTVSARSILGALASLEFEELWCVSENDIYTKIQEFIAK